MCPVIPDDIIEEASRLTESAWQLKHPELAAKVAAALLAERNRAYEECAGIADHGVKWSPPIGGGVERWIDESCGRIAAAIQRSAQMRPRDE